MDIINFPEKYHLKLTQLIPVFSEVNGKLVPFSTERKDIVMNEVTKDTVNISRRSLLVRRRG